MLLSSGGGAGGGGGGAGGRRGVVPAAGVFAGVQSPVQSSANFARGERATVSVRLRKKKTEVGRRLAQAARHSGDFSFFQHNNAHSGAMASANVADSPDANGGDGGDWAYITFPNGVPTVQDIRTNAERMEAVAASACPTGPAAATPVKVVTREVPGVILPGAAALTGQERLLEGPSEAERRRNHRRSGDFSAVSSKFPPAQRQLSEEQQRRLYSQESVPPSRVTPDRSVSRETGRRASAPRTIFDPPTPTTSSPASSRRSSSSHNQLRRRSEQPAVAPKVTSAAISTKRCSGEFNFVSSQAKELRQVQEDQDGEEVERRRNSRNGGRRSASSGAGGSSGLGRRAATQLQIEQRKKNSYNAAVYKSEENLVKVGEQGKRKRFFVYFFLHDFPFSFLHILCREIAVPASATVIESLGGEGQRG